MKTSTVLTGLGAATMAAAQRPADMSICDYYTTGLLKDNTAENQQKVLTLVVNTVVIGNYSESKTGMAVPGILAKANYMGEDVNLLPYFSGMLASTNGGDKGVAVNFLDGGAAEPLKNNMPANSENSAQYKLLTHLYGYFGMLLGCSEFGSKVMPYSGSTSMYKVHKFMDLSAAEVGYFISQVGAAAASFGVADSDVQAVAKALNDAFGYRCEPPASIPASAEPMLQSICTDDTCPLSPNATCDAYAHVMKPSMVGSSMMSSSTSMPYGYPHMSSSGMAMSTGGYAMPTGGMSSSASAMPTGGMYPSGSSSGMMPSGTSPPINNGAAKSGAFAGAAGLMAAVAYIL